MVRYCKSVCAGPLREHKTSKRFSYCKNMEEHVLGKLFKKHAGSAEGATRRSLTKTFIEEKKHKAISPIESFLSRAFKPGNNHVDLARKSERVSSEPPVKVRPSNDKSQKQMDVKHTTMLTNLASSYYEKIKTKPESSHKQNKLMAPSKYRNEEGRGASDNILNSIQKIKIRESVLDSRINDNYPLALSDNGEEKVFFVVNSDYEISTDTNPQDNSSYDSNVTSNDTQDGFCSTDIDVSSLQKDLSYSKTTPVKGNHSKESKSKKSQKHFEAHINQSPSADSSTSFSYVSNSGSSKGKIRHQECSTDAKILNDTGTNPSNSFLVKFFEANKIKNQKSSIPIKSISKDVVDSLQKIRFIVEEIRELGDEINMFVGSSIDHRDYVYMDEVMMRNLIKLDNLETHNNVTIRTKRKEAIQFIQSSMNRLQRKLTENQATVELEDTSVSVTNDSLENRKTNERKIRSAIKISKSH